MMPPGWQWNAAQMRSIGLMSMCPSDFLIFFTCGYADDVTPASAHFLGY